MHELIAYYINMVEVKLAFGMAIGAAIIAAHSYYMYRKQRKDARAERRRRAQERLEEKKMRSLSYRKAEAERAGFHPLAALGVDVSVPPSQQVFEDYGAARDVGKYLGKSVGSAIDAKRENDMYALSKRQEEARALGLELDAITKYRDLYGGPVLSSDAQEGGLGILSQGDTGKGNPAMSSSIIENDSGLPGQAGAEMVKPQVPWWRAYGVSAGLMPLKQLHMDEDRWLFVEVNKDISELLEDNLPFKIRYYVHEGKRYARALGYTVGDPNYKEWRAKWARLLPRTSKDWYWRYYPKVGQWRLMPVKGAQIQRGRFHWDPKARGKDPWVDMPH